MAPLCEIFLWILIFFGHQFTGRWRTPVAAGQGLACYDCSETFKYVWEPYTECQAYPRNATLRPCLGEELYCKVERTTYRSMTVSITRGCTKECWYGCYASGYGLTKLKCTSCCQATGCNTDNGGPSLLLGGSLLCQTVPFLLALLV